MTEHQIKVLTLNTWGIAYTADIDQRVTALATALSSGDYDIVCLQEVWQKDNFKLIADGARSGGLIYQHYFKSGRVGSGLATFSRHPIVDVNFHKFRLAGRIDSFWHGDYVAGKGVGITRINTPAGIVDVYNTHTLAQYNPDEIDKYKAHRATQHYEVTQFIRQHSQGNAVIAMGDFNMLDHQIGYRLVTQLSNLRDSWVVQNPNDNGTTYIKANIYNKKKNLPLDERLDYIFIGDGNKQPLTVNKAVITLTEIEGQNIPYSDHHGVEVDLTITTKSRASKSTSDTVATKAILEELADTLAVGIMDAEYRQQAFKQRAKSGANAMLPVAFFWRLMNKASGKWIMALLGLYSFSSWFVAEFGISDEITQMTTIAEEIQHRINALD